MPWRSSGGPSASSPAPVHGLRERLATDTRRSGRDLHDRLAADLAALQSAQRLGQLLEAVRLPDLRMQHAVCVHPPEIRGRRAENARIDGKERAPGDADR